MNGFLETYVHWKNGTYKSLRPLTALLNCCFNKSFIHMNRVLTHRIGALMLFQSVVQDNQKPERAFFFFFLAHIIVALQRKCNAIYVEEQQHRRWSPVFLPHSQAKKTLLSISQKTQTFRNIKILFWAAEMISGHSCQSWHSSCAAALVYLKGISHWDKRCLLMPAIPRSIASKHYNPQVNSSTCHTLLD